MMQQQLFAVLAVVVYSGLTDACREWRHPGSDDLSWVYAEAPEGSGSFADHLGIYVTMRQLRQDLDVNAVMSRETKNVLNRVFEEESLRDVPVFEDVFCKTGHPDTLGFETLPLPFHRLVTEESYKRGNLIRLDMSLVAKDHPDSHRFTERYYEAARRLLKFKHEDEVETLKAEIAHKMDLEPSEVTFVAVFNQRKSQEKQQDLGLKNFKKSYFQDGMEDFRESYDNVAFLYLSNIMSWGKKHLRDEEDLYFVGEGSWSDEATGVEATGHDLAVAASCDHTIVSRGVLASWAAQLAGGEYYTEYGSFVPNRVIEKMAAAGAAKAAAEEGGGGGPLMDKEGFLTLHFPNAENKDSEDQGWMSWLKGLFFT